MEEAFQAGMEEGYEDANNPPPEWEILLGPSEVGMHMPSVP